MNPRHELEQAIRIRFKIGPWNQISDAQLNTVIASLSTIAKTRPPTDEEWNKVITENIPNTGKYVTAGEDMADLNKVLMQIINPPRPGSTQTKAR